MPSGGDVIGDFPKSGLCRMFAIGIVIESFVGRRGTLGGHQGLKRLIEIAGVQIRSSLVFRQRKKLEQ